MGTQLIVVVHGVGVRQAGVSTDLLSTALEPPQPTPSDSAPAPDDLPRFVPQSSDDFHLREHPRHDRQGKAQVFPARLRRFRAVGGSGDGPRERVVADFFWGDIAEPRGGAPGLVLGLFRVAMGLGHAIRENARAVFPQASGPDRLFRAAAAGAVLTLHGPVIALNLLLLSGLALHWLLAQAELPEALAAWGLAAGAIAGGLVALRRMNAFLSRHMAGWVVLAGGLVAGMLLADMLGAVPQDFDSALIRISCGLFTGAEVRACQSGYTGIYLIGLRLYAALVLALMLTVALTLLAAAGSAWRWRQGRPPGVVDVTVPALGLMLVLWFLLISAIWGAVGTLPVDIIPEPTHVTSALRGLLPAVAALALMAGAAGVVQLRKRALKRDFDPARYMDDPDGLAERYRLIFCPRMLGVLTLFLVLLVAVGMHAVAPAGWPGVEAMRRILAEGTALLLAGVAALGVLLVTRFREPFAAGLGIATDVLAWINDQSWSSRGPGRAEGKAVYHTRTWFERALRMRAEPPDDTTPQGYWLRRRIRERMNVLMAQLIRDEAPDEIVVVSHSQGTVIALEVLASEARDWRAALPEGGTLRLITMGSPYTHLYNRYFPMSFPPPAARAAWRRREAASAEEGLDDWVNLFRVDDFVGTHIDAPRHHGKRPATSWPQDIPLPAGGHTNYWTDRTVARHLRALLRPTGGAG